MNGAQSLVASLTMSGVSVCFANPGTSEMHFVAALDTAADLRAVLCLFEGVATGAADGYGRVLGRPAATLLHLGPGLANGLANLHNARRARSPVVNIVGDHATYHKRLDAPLESDIDALAGTVSAWARRSSRPEDVGSDAAAAVAATRVGGGAVTTLILPADVSWGKDATPAAAPPPRPWPEVAEAVVAEAAAALKGEEPAVLLLGGAALREPALSAAARIAAGTGCRVLTETFTARLERGAGRPAFPRLAYFAEMAEAQLAGAGHLVLAGAAAPVAFFAYPGRPGDLVPPGCQVHLLALPGEDVGAALAAVAERVDAGIVAGSDAVPGASALDHPSKPGDGSLDAAAIGAVIGAHLPEGAVLVEEAITASLGLAEGTAGAAPHDWLGHTGGAIGQGLPVATGAALADPRRRVVCVEADGSAMYTVQALWTQAREGLDVTTIVISNRAYAILQIEMHRVQAQPPGPAAAALLDLGGPDLDLVALARGFGVPAVSVSTVEELDSAVTRSLAEPGPSLIEAVLPAR
jgi:acetolactate synthase-1/2/3 large subunit